MTKSSEMEMYSAYPPLRFSPVIFIELQGWHIKIRKDLDNNNTSQMEREHKIMNHHHSEKKKYINKIEVMNIADTH